METSSKKPAAGALRAGCLNFTELSAISVANIGPTLVAALVVPLMYASAGNASWLAYLFGTIMLLFVTFNLNQFARRSAATGSMHAYTVMGLGATTGGISGWCLVWAYLFDGIAGVAGFAIFGNALFGMLGFQVPNVLMFAILCFIIWFLAYEDVQISSIVMLVFEALSITMILILCAVVLSKHKFALDTAQLTLKGSSLSGIAMGVNIAVFSLVGFENATAFGEEAKEPLVTIPRVLIVNLILTGLFFVLILLHRDARLHRLQDAVGQGRYAAEYSGAVGGDARAGGADVIGGDRKLLRGRSRVSQFRRADSLLAEPPRAPSSIGRRRARHPRNAARRSHHNGRAALRPAGSGAAGAGDAAVRYRRVRWHAYGVRICRRIFAGLGRRARISEARGIVRGHDYALAAIGGAAADCFPRSAASIQSPPGRTAFSRTYFWRM